MEQISAGAQGTDTEQDSTGLDDTVLADTVLADTVLADTVLADTVLADTRPDYPEADSAGLDAALARAIRNLIAGVAEQDAAASGRVQPDTESAAA